jgi:hypothetical protein
MKIQSRCERNSWFLNVNKWKTKTFSRTPYPVELDYMLAGTVLDHVSSINDLEVIMDEKMNCLEYVDVMVGKAFEIYQKTVIQVQRSIHSLHVFGLSEYGVRQLCMEPIL